MKCDIELKNPINGEILVLPHKLTAEVKIVKPIIKDVS